jgi:hypothetical protein
MKFYSYRRDWSQRGDKESMLFLFMIFSESSGSLFINLKNY